MKLVAIGYDNFLKKDVKKINFESSDLPKVQLFNTADVIAGNPNSNIAIAFVYNWKTDNAPEDIRNLFQKLSNYAALTGYWRTTNGARYAFANILANPNINKILLLVFENEDNGHLLADALRNFWKNGINENNVIISSKAPNPKFEQVPKEALERIRQQSDLLILKNIKGNYDEIEALLKELIQEPENAISLNEFEKLSLEFHSNTIKNNMLYDDGARFEKPFILDLSTSAQNVRFEQKNLIASVGQSVQASNLKDALENTVAFILKNGSAMLDQRNIITMECRSIAITILNPLEKIPDNFSKEYLDKYLDEFLNGRGEKLDEFVYTYHERIFKKWGNQPEKIIALLKQNPNTRRALIALWDPDDDLGNESPPCLDFIWAVIRDNSLELHVVYRSHHIATVTEDGKLLPGEGAFVPNIYAIASLQHTMAKALNIKSGPLVLTDFSGHLYVSRIKC
ncbi:hypothetical protein HYU07_00695 [Candidatus Woesearchaeota archaeon]|nr:hypothetical protein [Candidatus Woesearchaeota archaeon]